MITILTDKKEVEKYLMAEKALSALNEFHLALINRKVSDTTDPEDLLRWIKDDFYDCLANNSLDMDEIAELL